MFKSLRSQAVALILAVLAMAAGPALASGGAGGVDVSDVVSAISGAATPIAAIGSATLLVYVGIKVYKWVRRAI